MYALREFKACSGLLTSLEDSEISFAILFCPGPLTNQMSPGFHLSSPIFPHLNLDFIFFHTVYGLLLLEISSGLAKNQPPDLLNLHLDSKRTAVALILSTQEGLSSRKEAISLTKFSLLKSGEET